MRVVALTGVLRCNYFPKYSLRVRPNKKGVYPHADWINAQFGVDGGGHLTGERIILPKTDYRWVIMIMLNRAA